MTKTKTKTKTEKISNKISPLKNEVQLTYSFLFHIDFCG